MDYLRNLWKRDFFVNIVIWSILIYLAIFFIDKYNLISKLIEIITSVSVGLIVLLIVIICISRLNLIDAYKIKSININKYNRQNSRDRFFSSFLMFNKYYSL